MMLSISLSLPSSAALAEAPSSSTTPSLAGHTHKLISRTPSLTMMPPPVPRRRLRILSCRRNLQVVRMAPEESRITRRSPLEFPAEWESPRPGRKPAMLPKFSPMKTPLPPPLPADPPLEVDEEEEEVIEEEEGEPEEEEPVKLE